MLEQNLKEKVFLSNAQSKLIAADTLLGNSWKKTEENTIAPSVQSLCTSERERLIWAIFSDLLLHLLLPFGRLHYNLEEKKNQWWNKDIEN